MSVLRSGVFRTDDPAALDPTSLAPALLESGWAFAHVDGARAASAREVLAAIGETLGFPEWYGANLDALWDCLRDLDGPAVLVWDDWARARGTDRGAFTRLVDVLVEHATAAGDLMVVLRGAGPELEPSLGVQPL